MKHIKVGDVHDLLDALPEERAFNPDKKYTRMQAIKALAAGVDPQKFTDHKNYHVRAYAWRKMGCPLPEDAGERAKFLASIKVKEKAPAPIPEPDTTPASE